MRDGNREAIAVLAPLLRTTADTCPVILLGAGASFRSGVPTAAEAVKQIARIVYSESVLGGTRPPERVKPTEWEPWLQAFDWFIHDSDRLAENFPFAVEHLLVPAEFRKRVLLDLMTPRNGVSTGYKVLSDLVIRGLVRTILTTNFDTCLLDALKERQPHIRHIHEVNRVAGDYDQFNVFNRCQVVWLHGRAEQYSDRNANGEIGALDEKLLTLLRPLVDGSPLIVVGYRGSEPSIMAGLLRQSREGRLDFPHGVFWCVRHGETPHPHVEALRLRLGSNFRLLSIDGFDELFTDLDEVLVAQDRYITNGAATFADVEEQAFDEQIVDEASIDDLDLDLALAVLRQYCEKLRRAPVTHETLLLLMREQGLLRQEEGVDKVTTSAILLFGKNTQSFFPHAVISFTESGKKREIYEGSLISQHRQLLEKLDTAEVNPLLKVKERRKHDERTAYPPRALVELLVNMIVHRDYSISEPSRIEARPSTEITFSNPGGLTSNLARRVAIEGNGRITLSETVTDQRNPSLSDIFFGISAMERAGTGLIDVSTMMRECGGASAFYHHDRENRFEAQIRQPQTSAGTQGVARSGAPFGLYILNVLPLVVIPDEISMIQLTAPFHARPHGLDLSDCGVFVSCGMELWSFVPLPILEDLLEPIVDRKKSARISRDSVESSPDTRRILSWLLRKHWERYLVQFKDDGLILEAGRKRRAYFEGTKGSGRTMTWNSPQRRGNRREVVKKRANGSRPWFENEGFAYEIAAIGGLWGVRIKPFYMFTGPDGKTPLPSFLRTSKATRRIKYDRNQNVESDLLFWSTLLGRGNETINIGHQHVDDLLVEASFLTVEVQEF
ncbi:SIR2 family protein [Petrachloros mirabilis]